MKYLSFRELVFIIIVSTFFSTTLSGQFSQETGLFPIKTFKPKDYGDASPQNWDIVQDKRGILYFANDDGVLEYDGIEWRLERVDNESAVRSLSIDKDGRIYAGAVAEFGYLAPDEKGDLTYKSLSKELPDSLKHFRDVFYVHCLRDEVYFQSHKYIFKYSNGKFTHWQAKKAFHTSFIVGDKILVNEPSNGLYFLYNGKITTVTGDKFPNNTTIFSVEKQEDNSYLVITGKKGLYKALFSENKIELTSLAVNDKWQIKDFTFYNASEIGKGTYTIGTWGNGLMVYSKDKILQLITKKSGLSNEIVLSQFFDKDKNMWLALSDGITKVEINSPLSAFGENLGIEGTVENMTRFNNHLYLATDRGLVYLPKYKTVSGEIYDQNRFVKISKISGGSWDVLNYNDRVLLVAGDDGVFEYDKKHNAKRILDVHPWKIYKSLNIENTVFVGHEKGLVQIERMNNKWEITNDFKEMSEQVYNFTEDSNGNLWAGTLNGKLLKISTGENYNIVRFDINNGIPENSQPYVCFFDKQVLVGTDDGLMKIKDDSIVRAKEFPQNLLQKNMLIHRMKTEGDKRLWLTTFENQKKIKLGYVEKTDKGLVWNATPFNTISEGIIHSFYNEENGTHWLGGTQGVYRYDEKVEKNYKKNFAALIRLNIIGKDSTIFFGSYFDNQGRITTLQPEVLKPELRYKYNSLEFRFAAQNTEITHPVLFSYMLDGYDRSWSNWTTEAKRYYTNLHEGSYTFRVKAKNIYGHESSEASYEFYVSPPWYRTIVAFILYVILLVLIIYVIVTQYTKYLREIIRQKTAEIREQKEIVEKKNEEITSSIKYAQRIQEAMLPPKKVLDERGTNYFILFKPRDIVSGDFYWFRNIGDYQVIAAADCTGHGVPGAFVSMLGMAFLNEISAQLESVTADDILNRLRAYVRKSLRQGEDGSDSKDGMDIALYVIDKDKKKLQFAGANNPLVIIRNDEIIQIKGDRMPIGQHVIMKDFQNNEFELEKGDMLYTFSDGYQDQFGGEKGQKFKIKRMKQLMVEISKKSLDEQRQILDDTIEDWMTIEKQIDDILVIGVRI